jgi:CYTH domain-containing protein
LWTRTSSIITLANQFDGCLTIVWQLFKVGSCEHAHHQSSHHHISKSANQKMGYEIERKFLIHHDKWEKLEKPVGDIYRQGYLSLDPNRTVRVRITPKTAFLTIKGLSKVATRLEFEYEIPVDEAAELLDNLSVAELSKVRYKIKFGNKVWEIDEFSGDNEGLIVAEIELESEEEKFEIPDWIDCEVTEDERYYNSNLTINPYKNWK